MSLVDFIQKMPKVELHVHIEGAIQPATLLELATRNGIDLPAKSIEELREWYAFKDFAHFIQIYFKASECIQTAEDVELVAREFLRGQAEQNIRYSEATWTPYTHYYQKGLPFEAQLEALYRARLWAQAELGVDMGIVIDLARGVTDYQTSMMIADWAVQGKDKGVIAFGIGGMETGNPASNYTDAFAYARQNGLASLPHAGEVAGPESIWDAIKNGQANRIYHGVRVLEDPELVAYLRDTQMPLDICPTSNVCLGVVPHITQHMLPRMRDAGLYVTINSDDPPMFNTTLTNEYQQIATAFDYDAEIIQGLVLNGVRASLLPDEQKQQMEATFIAEFTALCAAD